MSVNGNFGNLEIRAYAHLLDTCKQDWFAVLFIIEDTQKANMRRATGKKGTVKKQRSWLLPQKLLNRVSTKHRKRNWDRCHWL